MAGYTSPKNFARIIRQTAETLETALKIASGAARYGTSVEVVEATAEILKRMTWPNPAVVRMRAKLATAEIVGRERIH